MLESPIEEIKNRLDIVEVVGSYIKLQKTGANFRAICPFHSEKKPSFFVSPRLQIFKCFGCGAVGDIFKFVMMIEGVEFGDALRMLAQRAGVELKRELPELRTERRKLYEICELAARFFEKQLEKSSVGKEAQKYLLGRKISEDSIKKWRLGYAPNTWDELTKFLLSKNYSQEDIEKTGLVVKREDGSLYDRFRGRIVFPIFDLNSQVVGFGARVFKEKDKEEIAKYINIPNTVLYDKGKILYGLDKAKVEIRRKDCCILVEGYTDVILAHQAGDENVVATSGTALTPYQLKILKRYSDNLIIGFDMDVAGDSATKRGIDLAQLYGFNIKVLRLPEGKDPAQVIAEDEKKWKEVLKNPKSIYEFYFESAFSQFDKETAEGKRKISEVLLPFIKRIQNKIEQTHWIQELAKDLRVGEDVIVKELEKVKLEQEIYGLEPEEMVKEAPKPKKEILEERMMSLVLNFPEFLEKIPEGFDKFFSLQVKQLIDIIKSDPKLEKSKIPSELKDWLNVLLLKAEIEGKGIEKKEAEQDFLFCLKELKSLKIKKKLDELSQQIREAEEKKDSKKVKKLVETYNQLSKEKW